jgi:hypothetical protein
MSCEVKCIPDVDSDWVLIPVARWRIVADPKMKTKTGTAGRIAESSRLMRQLEHAHASTVAPR